MFELSIAYKYLIPRWRQLSVSIISLVSTLVIALVVWLIVVFFSVKDGLENNWVEKITAITAPVRITPTPDYYHSYYFLADTISAKSDYTSKTLGEKLHSIDTDPYDPSYDEEIPLNWQNPDLDNQGKLKDLVKIAFSAALSLKDFDELKASEFETTAANLRLRLLRNQKDRTHSQQFLEHASLIGSFDADNTSMARTLIPPSVADFNNLLHMQAVSWDNIKEENPSAILNVEKSLLADHLDHFFNSIDVTALKTPEGIEIPVKLATASIKEAKSVNQIRFEISGKTQGHSIQESILLENLEIGQAKLKSVPNPFLAAADEKGVYMPSSLSPNTPSPILLPKGFKDNGALIGDQGYLSYYLATPTAVQEQRVPVFIAGFYDPGIIPIGGKYILAGRELTALIRASYNQADTHLSNGINLRFKNIGQAPLVKAELQKAFEKAGIASYWNIETYQEYEFSKAILQQLQSEKNLFSLISLIIILVACSNIISMLIILVNDKKLEIGILRSMGATSASIAAIFGICGIVMGTMGSLVGITAAILTLRYVNELVGFLSSLQGHDLFNPIFYGTTLPTELSFEALLFVCATTAAVSLLAGIIPAFKAGMMRPSAILRAE